MAAEVLGVDYGGVICDHLKTEDVYLPLPYAFEVLRRLKEERFGDNIFVVSHADMQLRVLMMGWLDRHDFPKVTGIPLARVHFCLNRRDKANICRQFGVTHFIDDRREVLAHLCRAGIPNLYHFQGRDEGAGKFLEGAWDAKYVASWQEVATELLG